MKTLVIYAGVIGYGWLADAVVNGASPWLLLIPWGAFLAGVGHGLRRNRLRWDRGARARRAAMSYGIAMTDAAQTRRLG